MGETQVTWNGCGDGEVTASYADLCVRETKEAKMETKVSLASIARNWVPSRERPERESSDGPWGPRRLAIVLGDVDCSVVWSGGRMPT